MASVYHVRIVCGLFFALVGLIIFETSLLAYGQGSRKRPFINSRISSALSSDSPPADEPEGKPSAIITLVGGDAAARHAVSLVQSLRDVDTKLKVVVLLGRGGIGSEACRDQNWKEKNNRSGVDCGGLFTIGTV